MGVTDEAVVRRFYEELCNDRKNELADDLVAAGHRVHDPQVNADDGPAGMAAAISTYQTGVDGHWEIRDIFSAGDKVVARWTGSGRHVGDVNGIPATGREVSNIEGLSVHRMEDGKIAETWQVWDTLGFLQQLGVIPAT